MVAGTWTDTDNSGATQNGNIWTFNGVPTGVYTFTFTPSGASAPCPNVPQTIEITVVDNCGCDDLPVIPLSQQRATMPYQFNSSSAYRSLVFKSVPTE